MADDSRGRYCTFRPSRVGLSTMDAVVSLIVLMVVASLTIPGPIVYCL